ncbi:hypothetical protein N499_0010 [Wolbachia pipientis wVitA]|nr:hypothetical protein N499_0010 [Wolbachia pipientis wVitA]
MSITPKKKLKSLSYTIGNTYMTESNSFARLWIKKRKITAIYKISEAKVILCYYN